MKWKYWKNLSLYFIYSSRHTQFKTLKKELHLPSPFAKTVYLFWPDFPKLHFFVDQGGACDLRGSGQNDFVRFRAWRGKMWREIQTSLKFWTVQIKKNYIYLDNFPMASFDCTLDWSKSEDVFLIRIIQNGNKVFGNFNMTISGSELSWGISIWRGSIGIINGRCE